MPGEKLITHGLSCGWMMWMFLHSVARCEWLTPLIPFYRQQQETHNSQNKTSFLIYFIWNGNILKYSFFLNGNMIWPTVSFLIHKGVPIGENLQFSHSLRNLWKHSIRLCHGVPTNLHWRIKILPHSFDKPVAQLFTNEGGLDRKHLITVERSPKDFSLSGNSQE